MHIYNKELVIVGGFHNTRLHIIHCVRNTNDNTHYPFMKQSFIQDLCNRAKNKNDSTNVYYKSRITGDKYPCKNKR